MGDGDRDSFKDFLCEDIKTGHSDTSTSFSRGFS